MSENKPKPGRPAGVPNTICGRVSALVDNQWVIFEMREKHKRADGSQEPGGIYVRKFHTRKKRAKLLSFADAYHSAVGQKLLPL